MIALKAAISNQSISSIAKNNIFPLLLFGFGILVSLFPFHSWAPKGYGVAPTGAVMMHAVGTEEVCILWAYSNRNTIHAYWC